MAAKKLTEYARFVKSYASHHPGDKALMKHAAAAWRSGGHSKAKPAAKRAKKAAKKATRAVSKVGVGAKHHKRVVGYDSRQVRLVPVKRGAHAGSKRATPIGRGLYRLSKNPGEWMARVKRAVSVDTVGKVAGTGGGIIAAAMLPMLVGSYNHGGIGVLSSAVAAALATGGAAILFPAAVVPVAVGGLLVVAIRGAIVFIPKALGWILKPILAWAGAEQPKGAQAGFQSAYPAGAQAGFQKASGGSLGAAESFGNTAVDSF